MTNCATADQYSVRRRLRVYKLRDRPRLEDLYYAWRVFVLFQPPAGRSVRTYGTAFGVVQDGALALITNRHVFQAGYPKESPEIPALSKVAAINVTVHAWDSGTSVEPPKRYEVPVPAAATIVVPDDDTVDIAGTLLSDEILIPVGGNDLAVFTGDLLATEETFSREIDVGDVVILPGFPADAHDAVGIRPIFRTGRVASDPRFDYRRTINDVKPGDGSQQLAIEANVIDGNSGSPVLAYMRSEEATLLGIAVGHIESKEKHTGICYIHKAPAIASLVSKIVASREQ